MEGENQSVLIGHTRPGSDATDAADAHSLSLFLREKKEEGERKNNMQVAVSAVRAAPTSGDAPMATLLRAGRPDTRERRS